VALEIDIELEFVDRAKGQGWIAEKFEFVGRRGAPDRLVLLPGGIICFIEFKRTPKDRPSPQQLKFKQEAEALSHHWLLTSSVDEAMRFCKNLLVYCDI